MIFRRIAQFKFDNNIFQMFMTDKNKIAFLKVCNGKYHYPTLKEFSSLITVFENDYGLCFYEENRHKKYKFTPYLSVGNGLKRIMITSLLVLNCVTSCGIRTNAESYHYNYPSVQISNTSIDNRNFKSTYEYGFYETEDFELLESSKLVKLYNNKYFDDLFGCENVSIDQVIETTKSNKNIPKDIKEFIYEFSKKLDEYYTDLELRVYNYNLEGVKIEFRSQDSSDFILGNSVAFYDYERNVLVLADNIDLKNNPKDRLVLRHELGHLFNHLIAKKDGYTIKYFFNDSGRGKYLKEALNVIFTTEPFMYDYKKKEITENMGYPITTNIVRVLLECMDYDIKESITHNVYNFQKKLNKVNKHDIDASVIEELLEIQWIEYSSDSIRVDDEDYKDLYSYVARTYIKKHVNSKMTYDEIMQIEKELEEKLLMGVSNDKYVYTDIIEEEFISFINKNNIIKHRSRGM